MIKIEQPFNNNVVMGWDRKHGEVVIVGKGIGFHAKKGDIIDESKIQKIFVANENEKLVDLSYTRLVTHVKYFAQRYVEDKESTKEDELMKKTVREVFHEEVDCIERLSDLLYDKFGRHITNSEGNYLVLHLRNCKE